jgi:hypothetical protein
MLATTNKKPNGNGEKKKKTEKTTPAHIPSQGRDSSGN